MAPRIEDYALIGDGQTAALVSRDGSIDWLCWPRFDSPACFAALLGTPEHGSWQISTTERPVHITRRYRPGTLILETDIRTPEGLVTLTDFMPARQGASNLVRTVFGREGRVSLRTELVLRFDYGSVLPWVTRLSGESGFTAVAGPDLVLMRSTVPLHGEQMRTTGDFSVEAGESVHFVLSYGPSHEPPPPAIDPRTALADTEASWRQWSGQCQHTGEWREEVRHSHIVLKALTYAPTGAIVAAPTTSLPEQIGGTRNWDYRYCWLRDATFALMSLMNAGYFEEASAWREWLLRAAAGNPGELQIMYGLAGERRLPEWEVAWLPGYEGSKPVRVGNAAYQQLQLDVFGEVMDAFHQARKGGLAGHEAGWALQHKLVAQLESVWQRPDEGIWEMRGPRQHFTHSKVMAWVAIDRAVRAVEEFGLPGPVQRWRELRQKIHADICERGFDAKLGSFVQAYGTTELDASLLLLPLVGFLPATDPRVQGTLEAIKGRLVIDDTFVLRYDTHRGQDGLPPGEGAFLACSFWLADNLVLQGRVQEARALFERLLTLQNDVGLLAEEYDPRTKRQLGNFPQAFSHLALANTARNLSASVHPATQRSQ